MLPEDSLGGEDGTAEGELEDLLLMAPAVLPKGPPFLPVGSYGITCGGPFLSGDRNSMVLAVAKGGEVAPLLFPLGPADFLVPLGGRVALLTTPTGPLDGLEILACFA